MAKLLYRLGRWSFLHKWKVIVAWLLLLAAVGGAAALLMKPMTSEFSIKGCLLYTSDAADDTR